MNTNQQIWGNHIKAWEGSDQSQRAYCLENDLSLPAFAYWRKKLKSISNKFTQVKVTNPAGNGNNDIIIQLPNGIQIKSSSSTNPEVLKNVVLTLKGLEC